MFGSLLEWLLYKGKDLCPFLQHAPPPPHTWVTRSVLGTWWVLSRFLLNKIPVNGSLFFLSLFFPSLVRMICVNSFQNRASHCFGQRSELEWLPRKEKHSQILNIIRKLVRGEHQMRAFISPVVQLLSNIDQSFIFLFSWNPMRSFSNSVFISRLEELQEEPPLKCTFSIFITPNYQHPKVLRQDCPSKWQELHLY